MKVTQDACSVTPGVSCPATSGTALPPAAQCRLMVIVTVGGRVCTRRSVLTLDGYYDNMSTVLDQAGRETPPGQCGNIVLHQVVTVTQWSA